MKLQMINGTNVIFWRNDAKYAVFVHYIKDAYSLGYLYWYYVPYRLYIMQYWLIQVSRYDGLLYVL